MRAETHAVPIKAKNATMIKAMSMLTNLITISPELAQSLIKVVTISSVIFGVLTGLGAGLTFTCQSILDAENDKKIAIAEKNASEARLQSELVKNSIKWRELNEKQYKTLRDFAKAHPRNVIFRIANGDPEALYYANSIANALSDVGVKSFKLYNFAPIEVDELLFASKNQDDAFNYTRLFRRMGIKSQMIDTKKDGLPKLAGTSVGGVPEGADLWMQIFIPSRLPPRFNP